ncbi:MAG: hypothetical protein KatS3mg117_3293 [Geminicoccaceae bacterium]|nr:MAG: hypothetical protein KatS3mg117_3293 [Geminicoccaceae bacterium]
MASSSSSGTATAERRGRGAVRRPAGRVSAAAASGTGRATSLRPVLLVVGLLALLGIGGWFLVRASTPPPTAPKTQQPHDPSRVYAVAEAIDHRQMRPVWALLEMAGLERLCEKARAFTVSRQVEGPGVVPTRFVVYCRDQGFWVVEADPARERWSTVGPLATREEAEAVIDREGEFLWGARPPGQRGLVGGLAAGR